MLLSRAIFKKNVLEAFYTEWLVVVHPCSNFSLRRQMAPLQSIKFQIANFRSIVIFRRTCTVREVCSLVTMVGPGGIAVPRSRHVFWFLVWDMSLHCVSICFICDSSCTAITERKNKIIMSARRLLSSVVLLSMMLLQTNAQGNMTLSVDEVLSRSSLT